MNENTYYHIAGVGSYLIKKGGGWLHSLILNNAVASGTVTIYDGTSASGSVIGIISLPATLLDSGPEPTSYDISFQKGLFIVVTTALDLTISYH